MKRYSNPKRDFWEQITTRSGLSNESVKEAVSKVFDSLKEKGDQALFEYAKLFDGVDLSTLSCTVRDIEINESLAEAIQLAKRNIEAFHRNQKLNESPVETMKGIKCWREARAIEKVGLYIPGGSAPLFSTLLMLAIPAKIAECKEIVVCTPPSKDGGLNEVIEFTANLVGIDKVYMVGGAQAIAAMTLGTEFIPKVNKIFGPGNQYVTQAKELAQTMGVSIDMPAGPSEVLVIADDSANPEYIAADLLSQAEHGSDSQVVLLSTSDKVLEKTEQAIEKQLKDLDRIDQVKASLENSFSVSFASLEECMNFSNFYAPEHLILNTKEDEKLCDLISNAGSVFVGKYSCESAGDYASGTNHTLPTNAYSKSYSGVSLDSFMKRITFQKLSEEGIKSIGPSIKFMAEAEGLMAHKNAVSIRLKDLT